MKYKITVEELTGENTLAFEAESHEDILEIVEKLKTHPDFGNDAEAFGLGLKLFTSVMMKQKSNPLFKNLMPHFKDFMKGLKGAGKGR
ncbi:DUF3861 domain-containing protein [Ancylomarina sp. 16SWW S1-10-2]|uniref:DUF3861 domain-containing protein n=1 Tax=Ancylomarina sp. 16SWW S1-10-2 TaxID=2499681 RepID=UPI0012AD996C|nr:DUF3861 domain-containing protein [Ancylomarina sp. 16SWW S1-10-2]MRT92605.1 DUF3861 family protein [Ancylomarina sp. 16SWW S1-10-2]